MIFPADGRAVRSLVGFSQHMGTRTMPCCGRPQIYWGQYALGRAARSFAVCGRLRGGLGWMLETTGLERTDWATVVALAAPRAIGRALVDGKMVRSAAPSAALAIFLNDA